jgi:pantoate--beta-alanine ligase
MRVIETVADLQAQSRAWRTARESVGMVPTMGALHDGHLGLVSAARADNDRVIVSIFVNPTQFNQKADLDAYPRTFDADAALLQGAGVNVVFHPPVGEMYPGGTSATSVRPGRVADLFEGEHRPGHFEGVATVVARLLNAGLPDRAYFGRKDAQQLAVIEAMVRDLAIPVEIVGCPTRREPDGLAMSSRNTRLVAPARRAAPALVRALAAAQVAFAAGSGDADEVGSAMLAELVGAPGVELEYAALVDPDTFHPAPRVHASTLVVIAARVGDVRLIDNATLGAGDVIRYAVSAPQAAAPRRPEAAPLLKPRPGATPQHGVPA